MSAKSSAPSATDTDGESGVTVNPAPDGGAHGDASSAGEQ